MTAGDSGHRIYSIPARENRTSNPYTGLFADAFEQAGWSVLSPDWSQRLLQPARIIHVHWPQRVVDQPQLWALRSFALWRAFIAVQRARGARLVWTTHNITAHDARNPGLDRRFMRWFTSRLDGFVSLSRSNHDAVVDAFPRLRDLPSVIAPHPVYGNAYPRPAMTGRGDVETVSVLGDIKPYKGLDRVLDALAAAKPDGRRYVIHGAAAEEAGRQLDTRVGRLRARGWDVRFTNARLSDQELVDALARTDLLLLPYRRGENSGLSLLAAEHGVPLLMSDLNAFRPLAEELGRDRAVLVSGYLSHRDIVEVLRSTRGSRGLPSPGFCAARTADAVAAQVLGLYRQLLGTS